MDSFTVVLLYYLNFAVLKLRATKREINLRTERIINTRELYKIIRDRKRDREDKRKREEERERRRERETERNRETEREKRK